ncbi:MAG: protein kinase [Gammaproteobacteria bacterium]|nr:protein kinase [Gammaproteobacteria bacterium]
MADFKTALDALGKGQISADALSKQLERLLNQAPQHATRLLAQLEEVHDQRGIDDRQYADIKRQINQYRRAHAAQTETGGEAGSESTVFAQDDNFEGQAAPVIGSEEATEVKGARRAPGRGAAADSTQVLADEERPVTGTGVDLDISSPSLDSSGPSSIPSSTGPTGTQWQAPAMSSEAAIAQEMGPGSVIKERFKLLDVLGVGGMGKVYKGIDLLKQEARDKNPYIALKLLNEDFKTHPEAFIALQRESSRQQKLAHPNIATVYDFDRIGGTGTPVFITMELMEGEPLNSYIKKVVRKQNGLPFPEAFKIVRQLAAALKYAHERRLVHSDFKPGNAFLCNDGTVKTLDFGIARAVKNPVTGEGEKTLFDPGKLGALTPAYASLEMLEGEEPDPRDDIYALGCVAYELLTGKHPYNKLPATTARENGLVPAPIRGLTKKSNRALRHALAFKREDRSPNVGHFIEEFEGKATWHKNPFAIAAAVLLVIGTGLIPTIRGYFHQQEIEQLITEIQGGDKQVIVAKLKLVRTLEKADQAKITDDAREVIQRYFQGEIAVNIDISGENYNFPSAESVLNQVKEFYPDSLFVQQQQTEIEFNKKQKLTDLYNNYIAALDPQAAQADPGTIDATKGILEIIRVRIDPAHPLLTDPRPSNAYRLAADRAFQDGNFDQAFAFIQSGLLTAPDDARLTDLQTKVQNAVRVAQLRETLGGVEFAAIADYKQNEQAIVELANLSSVQESPILETLATGLKSGVGQELGRVLKEGGRSDAETLAGEYGNLLSALQLQQELTQIKLAHLAGEARTQAIQQIVAADKSVVDEKLTGPALDDAQWETQLLASIRELDSLKDEDPSIAQDLAGYRDGIARLYVDRATEILQANRFDAAEGFIVRGERFAPGLAMLQQARSTVAQTKAEFEKQQQINDLKEQFTIQTEADRVAEAQELFDRLKTLLPSGDPYVETQAPSVLAASYQRLAERRAEAGDYANALKLAQAGLDLAPRNAILQGIRNEYRVAVNITELTEVFRTAGVFTSSEVIDIARKVNEIEKDAPTRYSEFRKQAETLLAERINALAQTDENSAAALADAALTIFPTSSVLADLKDQFQLKPWPQRAVAEAAVQTGALSQAARVLQEAAGGEFAGHPDVLALQRTVEEKVKQANTQFEALIPARAEAEKLTDRTERRTALTVVRNQLNPILAVWSDNPDFNKARGEIDQAIAATRILTAEKPLDIATAAQTAAAWTPVASDRPCTTGLAGHGTRSRAICFDLVNTGWRGPLMVVVPAGGEVGKEFAIGKYEISAGDWAKYCALSGKCKPETNKERFDDPQTGISLQQAQDYVQWLSERTGKTYRLPTAGEWEYAASTGGKLTADSAQFKQIKGTLNCRVTMGDKVLKGTGTASVKSGASNEWGLKNFVGNVQEWVIDGSGASARGGAFSDAINNCDLSTVRPHSGGADDATGFRVVLDEVG